MPRSFERAPAPKSVQKKEEIPYLDDADVELIEESKTPVHDKEMSVRVRAEDWDEEARAPKREDSEQVETKEAMMELVQKVREEMKSWSPEKVAAYLKEVGGRMSALWEVMSEFRVYEFRKSELEANIGRDPIELRQFDHLSVIPIGGGEGAYRGGDHIVRVTKPPLYAELILDSIQYLHDVTALLPLKAWRALEEKVEGTGEGQIGKVVDRVQTKTDALAEKMTKEVKNALYQARKRRDQPSK